MKQETGLEEKTERTLPVTLMTRMLQGLLTLALLYTLYFAKTLLLPIVVAL